MSVLTGIELITAYINIYNKKEKYSYDTTFSMYEYHVCAHTKLLSYSVDTERIPNTTANSYYDTSYITKNRTLQTRFLIDFPDQHEFDHFMQIMYRQPIHIETPELIGYGIPKLINYAENNSDLIVEIEFVEFLRNEEKILENML